MYDGLTKSELRERNKDIFNSCKYRNISFEGMSREYGLTIQRIKQIYLKELEKKNLKNKTGNN